MTLPTDPAGVPQAPWNPHVITGVDLLRQKWPQTFSEADPYGNHLVFVPSMRLSRGYDADICTVLFFAPVGFPANHPRHFFTDIPIRLANGARPTYTRDEAFDRIDVWPQWGHAMRWFWRLQAWNPNRDSLLTFVNVIRQRLMYAR